jgi:hypothetical protein
MSWRDARAHLETGSRWSYALTQRANVNIRKTDGSQEMKEF